MSTPLLWNDYAAGSGMATPFVRNLHMKDSNSAFDEVFIRISLQNREFSLIIVYVGSAKASRVGHDPVYGRHAGV